MKRSIADLDRLVEAHATHYAHLVLAVRRARSQSEPVFVYTVRELRKLTDEANERLVRAVEQRDRALDKSIRKLAATHLDQFTKKLKGLRK